MLFGLFYLLTDLLSKHFLRLYSHCQFGNLERDGERWRNSDCPGGLSACFFFPPLHHFSLLSACATTCVSVCIPQYMVVCMYLCVALGVDLCWTETLQRAFVQKSSLQQGRSVPSLSSLSPTLQIPRSSPPSIGAPLSIFLQHL